ncbi:alkaline phosphatase [Mobilicoccus massiliensis]|uniref:alkaline phosphatase n=1 Tax=Mobilicoccus massiliensis TaxID=1522310 RepID=UPI00058B0FE4|nr:alkaline phosphatase [Mobilicoccus massiliensis]
MAIKRTVTVATAVASLAIIGATTATGFAGGHDRRPSPTLDRAAAGAVDTYGGARRVDGDQRATIASALKPAGATNVILIIGDGMGASEITIGRNYLVGAGGQLRGLDALPITGQMTHYSVDRKTGKPDYTPDSAATGSAWATGVKTYDNAVSVDRHGTARPTMLQLAKRSGRATGNVTTSEIQDATPAVQVANISLRKCYGPNETSASCPEAALENGGKGSISEQLLETRPDLTFGGGSKTFSQKAKAGPYKDMTLADQARKRGFTYLTKKEDLAKIGSADQRHPVLGLFSEGNMPVKFASLVASKGGAEKAAVQCQANKDFEKVPTLGDMTGKAIDVLSKSRAGQKKGFLLQVESASIDKKDHAADACGQIGETAQIDDAVAAALDFAKKDGNTLVIVTADHAHTSQIVDGATPGLDARLQTHDGADMIVTYGTAPLGGSQQHTGAQIPVAAYGPGAAQVAGLIDQTDLFFTVRDGMNAYRKH